MENGTHSINSELIESEPEAHLRVEDLSMSNGLENGKLFIGESFFKRLGFLVSF